MRRPLPRSCPAPAALFVVGLLSAASPPTVAQTPAPTAEQYQDAQNQLRAKQDKISEQATEIGKLKQRVADLEKQATAARADLAATHAQDASLREQFAAWTQFVAANPRVRLMWTAFFPPADVSDRIRDLLGDPQWPFSV